MLHFQTHSSLLIFFETKAAPGGGSYVVDVSGVEAENKRFRETLLYDAEMEVRPVAKGNAQQIQKGGNTNQEQLIQVLFFLRSVQSALP